MKDFRSCAVGLARLGDSVTFAATEGADAYGDFCADALRRAGVDVSLVQSRADLKTGITVSITSTFRPGICRMDCGPA
jgi:sugar/nucleoside kinase (ribokinase family)